MKYLKNFIYYRLSYQQRIREILPDSFSCFIPAKAEPDYKYAKEGAGKLLHYFFSSNFPSSYTARRISFSFIFRCNCFIII